MSQTAVLDAPNLGSTVKRLSLRQGVTWTFVSNLVYAASRAGILAVLVTFGTAELVGLFNLGLRIVVPALLFTDLSLRAVQATDARREYEFRDYFGLRLFTTLLALPAIAAWATYL